MKNKLRQIFFKLINKLKFPLFFYAAFITFISMALSVAIFLFFQEIITKIILKLFGSYGILAMPCIIFVISFLIGNISLKHFITDRDLNNISIHIIENYANVIAYFEKVIISPLLILFPLMMQLVYDINDKTAAGYDPYEVFGYLYVPMVIIIFFQSWFAQVSYLIYKVKTKKSILIEKNS